MTDGFLVTGVGLACLAGNQAGELLDAVRQKRVEPVSGNDLIATSTMEAAVARCPLDELGPIRLARYLSREAALFLYAGATAARRAGVDPTGQPRRVGVVCATRTAGLSEYQQMYQSGRTGKDTAANLVRGPQSSFNAPASHLCLYLGIQGACLTLAGGPASGLTALRYAQSLLRAGRIDVALAGGVDGLSPGDSAPPSLPGEAAGVLALTVSRPDVSRPGLSKAATDGRHRRHDDVGAARAGGAWRCGRGLGSAARPRRAGRRRGRLRRHRCRCRHRHRCGPRRSNAVRPGAPPDRAGHRGCHRAGGRRRGNPGRDRRGAVRDRDRCGAPAVRQWRSRRWAGSPPSWSAGCGQVDDDADDVQRGAAGCWTARSRTARVAHRACARPTASTRMTTFSPSSGASAD